MFVCERCGKEFEDNGTKSKRFCSSHCRNSHPLTAEQKIKYHEKVQNSKRILDLKEKREQHIKYLNETECVCEKCGKTFKGDYRSYKGLAITKVKLPRFCSRACANSRNRSEEYCKMISEKLKVSYGGAARLAHEGKESSAMKKARRCGDRAKATLENGKLLKGTCPVCKKEFTFHRYTPRKYCSRKCWDKVSGGYREGSVRNYVHGTFEGYYYDSSWELIWIKWALKNNVSFERNTKGFPYIYKGEEHKYYPDFYIQSEDLYVEIKGRVDDLWEAKKAAFPYELKVLTGPEIRALELEEFTAL